MNKILKNTPVFLRIFTTLLIFIIIIAFIQVFCHEVIGQIIIMQTKDQPKPELTHAQQLEKQIYSYSKRFLPDGTIHLVNIHHVHANNDAKCIVYNQDLKELYSGTAEECPYKYLDFSQQIYYRFGRSYQSRFITHAINPVLSSDFIVPVVESDMKILERWRYDFAKNMFEGFDINGNRIGYIGKNGLSDNLPDAQPFEKIRVWNARSFDKINAIVILISDYKIYEVDFSTKKTRLFIDTGKDKIRSVSVNHIAPQKTSHSDFLVTAGSKKLLARGNNSEILNIKPGNFPDNLLDHNLSFAIVDDKIYLQTVHSDTESDPMVRIDFEKWKAGKQEVQYRLTLYELTGENIVKEISTFNWSITPNIIYNRYTPTQNKYYRCRNYSNSIATPIYSFVIYLNYFIRKSYQKEYSLNIIDELIQLFYEIQPVYFSINLSIAVILAAIVLVHGLPRRTSNIRLAGWIIFVLLFNIAGFLTYMFLCYTPVIRCHSCGRKRGLESHTCPACDSLLKEPEQRETDLLPGECV